MDNKLASDDFSRTWSRSSGLKIFEAGNDPVLRKLKDEPETLTDSQLTQIPLRNFSKALGNLSSRRIINVYLRWLEIQRKAPLNNFNQHWQSTITHWTQSIRARGFSLKELISEVDKWKAVRGPFSDPHTSYEPRFPPSSSDITFGWNRTAEGAVGAKEARSIAMDRNSYRPSYAVRYEMQPESKLDRPLSQVPASYICNRCKRGGHFVGDCPTNDDPSYDLAPNQAYTCKFCGRAGVHYCLFCPRNPDPNSIFKRRLAKGTPAEISPADRSVKRTMDASRGPPQSGSQLTPSRSSMPPEGRNQLGSVSPRTNFEVFTNAKRSASRHLLMESSSDVTDFDEPGFGMSDIAMEDTQDDTFVKSEMLGEIGCGDKRSQTPLTLPLLGSHRKPADLSTINNGTMALERSQNDRRKLQTKLPLIEPQVVAKQSPQTTRGPSVHDEFLRKLFANIPSQNVNKRPPRLTALDMWDISDERKHREEMSGIQAISFEEHTKRYLRNKTLQQHDEYSRQAGKVINTDAIMYVPQECKVDEDRDQEEKMRAAHEKIRSIESLRTKLLDGENIKPGQVQRIENEDLSQQLLDEISRDMEARGSSAFSP